MARPAPLIALALAWCASAAAQPPVAPALEDGPAAAGRRTVSATLRWEGGPADVVAWNGSWTVVERGATSPHALSARPGTPLRVVRGGEVVAEARVWSWGPADVAAWSGEGLRGAVITALAPVRSGLWAGTVDAGLGWWNGERWAHLARRHGLPSDTVRALDVVGGTRWIVDPGGVTRIAGDGTLDRWTADALGEPLDIVALDEHAAVIASTTALWRVSASEGIEALDLLGGCSLPDATHAVCPTGSGDLLVALDGGPPVPLPAGTVTVIPRMDGVWAVTDGELIAVVDGQVTSRWSLPSGALADATRLGGGMLLAAGEGGAWHLHEDGADPLTVAGGLPSPTARVTAAGPAAGKAWLGTERGVALVNEARTATALPLAPLAAGIPTTAVAGDCARALVASADGLVWLGPRPPRGIDALVAAVPGGADDVLARRDDTWAVAGESAWHLDRRGALTRWDLGAAAVAALPVGRGVALATIEGLRLWLPGARLLGPLDPVPGLRAASVGLDGGVWTVGDEGVRRLPSLGDPAWDVPGVRDVAANGRGALLATAEGLRIVSSGRPGVGVGWPDADTGPLAAVAAGDGHTWAVGDDGRVWRDGAAVLSLGDETAPRVRGLQADAYGAWIATERGLWRVVAL